MDFRIKTQTDTLVVKIETALKNNHNGNPLALPNATEIDQVGLAATNFDNDEPLINRYAYVKIDKRTVQGALWVFRDGTGLFRCRTYEGLDFGGPVSGDPRPAATGQLGRLKIRFWRFGCQHNYREMTQEERQGYGIILGHCEHANVCSKCGHIYIYDSSD